MICFLFCQHLQLTTHRSWSTLSRGNSLCILVAFENSKFANLNFASFLFSANFFADLCKFRRLWAGFPAFRCAFKQLGNSKCSPIPSPRTWPTGLVWSALAIFISSRFRAIRTKNLYRNVINTNSSDEHQNQPIPGGKLMSSSRHSKAVWAFPRIAEESEWSLASARTACLRALPSRRI